MVVEIVPITHENIDLAAKAGAKFGIPRSIGWLERCLFDPTVKDLVDDDVRGHVAVQDGKDAVAIQGYYYMPGYFKQEKILINTGCIMGAEAKFGEELICCFDANRVTRKNGQLSASNCMANARSAKMSMVYSKTKEGPVLTRERRFAVVDVTGYVICLLRYVMKMPSWLVNSVWRLLRPVSWVCARVQALLRPRFGYSIRKCMSFRDEKYAEFWEKFLVQNDGLITSRSPERMAWLFDESIKAGMVTLIVAEKDNKMCGYVLLRKLPHYFDWVTIDCGICDICALNGDAECLKALAFASISAASRMGAFRVCMHGAALPRQEEWLNVAFCHRRVDDHPVFLYKTKDAKIENSLQDGKGWFFGPMDGEACLGSGGYIDL